MVVFAGRNVHNYLFKDIALYVFGSLLLSSYLLLIFYSHYVPSHSFP